MRVKKILIFLIILVLALLMGQFNFKPANELINQGEIAGTNDVQEETLKVVFLDVGQGDAIFIETPSKKQILIDGGDNNMVLEKLNGEMSIIDRSLDLVILTHPHADHVTGLIEVLKRYEVGEVWLTGILHTSTTYLDFLNLIKEKNITVRITYGCDEIIGDQLPSADTDKYLANNITLNGQTGMFNCGKKLTMGEGMEFAILSPLISLEKKRIKNLNNSSIVMKLFYGQNSLIFAGDAENTVEEELLGVYGESNGLNADILKIGHHGSTNATGEKFLTVVKPAQAVISVGKDNPFGHPSLRIIRRLERAGIKILRTDEISDIKFLLDGKEAKISTNN